MGELPSNLLQFIKKTCIKCDDVFLDHRDLWRVFNDTRLIIWQERLPEASNTGQRIEGAIHYLQDKKNVQGESALALFMGILSERYPLSDERHVLLLDIIHQLQIVSPRQEESRSSDALAEANTLQVSMLAISELEPMRHRARSVALIKSRRYRLGEVEYRETGTGWLIAPGLVLTCWHVVAALMNPKELPPTSTDLRLQIADMLLFFDQTESGKGGTEYSVKALEYPLNKTDKQDFAILRLEDRNNHPYSQFGYIPVELDTPFTTQTQLSIIQHPWGEHQQVAIPGYFVSRDDTTGRIFYTTETQPGTSGAPVLKRHNWFAIALHNGRLGETSCREGTRIKYVLSELQERKPTLYHEILQAQSDLGNPLPPMHLTSPLSSYTTVPQATFQGSFSSTEAIDQEVMPSGEATIVTNCDSTFTLEMSTAEADQSVQPVSSQTKNTSQEASLKEYRRKITEYRPKIRHIRTILKAKRTLYSDECHQLLVSIRPLYKPINEMEKFTTQKLSRSYPGRLELMANLHHLQALLTNLTEDMTTFCQVGQDAVLEERQEIIQRIDELDKALSLKRPGKRFSLWLHR